MLLTRNEQIQNAAERIDVHFGAGRFAGDLFGRHEKWGASSIKGLVHQRVHCIEFTGNAKIKNDESALPVVIDCQHHVLRFQISVDQFAIMRVLHRLPDFVDKLINQRSIDPFGVDQLLKCFPLEKVHHNVGSRFVKPKSMSF